MLGKAGFKIGHQVIRRNGHNILQALHIFLAFDDHKIPGLQIARRRGHHAGRQDFFNFFPRQRFGCIFADTASFIDCGCYFHSKAPF